MDFSNLSKFALSTQTNVNNVSKNKPVDKTVDKSVDNTTQFPQDKDSKNQFSSSPTELKNTMSKESNGNTVSTSKNIVDPLQFFVDDEKTIDEIENSENYQNSILNVPEYPVPSSEAVEQQKAIREFRKKKRNDPSLEDSRQRKLKHRFTSSSMMTPEVEKPTPVVEFIDTTVQATKGSLTADSRTPAERWNAVKPRERIWRYEGDTAKMNANEKAFFERAGLSLREHNQGLSMLDYMRPPQGFDETDAEREERIARISEAAHGLEVYKRNNRKKFTYKHEQMIEFLAMFRFAKPSHLSYMFAESPQTTYKRLLHLRDIGLVINKPMLGTEDIWFLTKTGMALSGYGLKHVTNADINYQQLMHNFLVTYLASNLWGSTIDVLHEGDNFPVKNRVDRYGEPTYGDELVSEFLLRHSLGKLIHGQKAHEFVPQIRGLMEREFSTWEDNGGLSSGIPSPEMMFGNEYMWVLTPPSVIDLTYHVPDLVVKRERNSDGSPNSIAVEFERGQKKIESLRKTMQAYKADNHIYKQVVWVVHKKTTHTLLMKACEDLGVLESGKVKIIPILTKDGVWKKPELWLL